MKEYPQHKILKADAYAVVLAWMSLPTAFLVLFVGNFLAPSAGSTAMLGLFGAFFILALTHVGLSLLHRCPTCEKHPTVQGFKPVHPNARSDEGLDGWSRVVWNVFRKRPFNCIHCGDEFLSDM